MDIVDVTNNVAPRRCRVSSAQSRYPTVIAIRPLLLLMMFYCWITVTATALPASEKASTATGGDRVTWIPPVSASVSPISVRTPQNHRFQLASLPLQDDSSGGERHGAVGRRTSIAPHRLAGSDGPGSRAAALPRPGVVNYSHPPATAAAVATVNAAPVIGTSRDRREGPGRISIRSTSPRRRSSFNAVFHASGTSFYRPDNYYLPTTTRHSIIVDGTATTSVKDSTYSGWSNSTGRSSSETGAKYTTRNVDRVSTFPGISEDANLDLKRDGRRRVRRVRRQNEVEPIEDVDGQLDSDQLNVTTITTTERTTTQRLRSTQTESPSMPLGSAALRYRSRGNFAALVDPLKTGGRVPALAESADKWRRLSTVGDNSTSARLLTEDTTLVAAATSTSRVFTDSDSIDVEVIHIAINDSANVNVTNSASVTSETLNDISLLVNKEMLNSTMVPTGERNCSNVTKSLGIQAVLRQRISDSAVVVCVYTFSSLFTLVAVCSLTSLILSLCGRCNHRSLRDADRQLSSQLVLGLVVLTAAARALHYIAVEYQLLATVATPGGLRAIYECWFPFIISAFFVYQRQFYGEIVTLKNGLASSSNDDCVKRVACWRDLRVFSLVFCFYLTFVFILCLLVEFCLIPMKAVFVLRFVFVLFAVSFSLANIPIITTTSGRHIATQVVLRALFVICAGFSAVNAATLLSDDFSLSLQQNPSVQTALEAADGVSEFFISVLLCVNSTLTFSRFGWEESRKSVSVGHKAILVTTISKRKVADHGQSSKLSTNSPAVHKSWLSRLLDCTLKKSEVVDAGSAAPQISLPVVHTDGWTATEDHADVDRLSPLPPSSRMMRSRSMLYNDHGFIRFRQDGDTDGESDARTLDDDAAGPRSVPASEYASAESLSFHRGPSSTGTPRWSRPGSPSLAGFRAPSIHLQDSIDRALDRCDIWRVGREQGQLSVDELRRIIELYADVGDCRHGNRYRQRRAPPPINYAEV